MPEIDPKEVRARLDAVITAMKQSGAWQVQKPGADAFIDMGAFGMNTMAFVQWLRFVFVPNVEKLIASNGPWPGGSMVAVHAAREGDGDPPVAELVPALDLFDALFEPEEEEDDDDDELPPAAPSPAAQAYDRSRAAFEKGEHVRALEAIREAIAVDPSLPNVQNFAGWVLLNMPSRTSEQLDEAIACFSAAMNQAPEEHVPLVNLCDALLAAGRDADAVAEAERATERPDSRGAGAHNWLGWRFMSSPETLERAIEHLHAAVRWRSDWGVAHANLAKALEIAHRADEAYHENELALGCADDFDRAFCHERMGAYDARHGWLRNALREFRAALREDRKRGGAREKTYREAMDWLEQQMRAAGIEWAPPDRDLNDEKWLRACELELPPGFGARNELGEPLADDVIEVERLVRAERWADAVRQLEALGRADYNKLFDAVGFAEAGADLARRAGHRAEALAMMRLVLDAYRYYASGATSGAEGLGRMEYVEAARAKLAAWEREGS